MGLEKDGSCDGIVEEREGGVEKRRWGRTRLLLEMALEALRAVTWWGWAKVAGAVCVVVVGAVLVGVFWRYVERGLEAFLSFTNDTDGWIAAALIGAAYTPMAVSLLPCSLLTLGAGFVFGVLKGTAVALCGATVGAFAAFLVSRLLVRHGCLVSWLRSSPLLATVDEVLGDSGWPIALMMRASPIVPFSILNYALGASPLGAIPFLLTSFFGMIPGTLLYAYIGSSAQRIGNLITDRSTPSLWSTIFFWTGMVLAVLIVLALGFLARRALLRALDKVEYRRSFDSSPGTFRLSSSGVESESGVESQSGVASGNSELYTLLS